MPTVESSYAQDNDSVSSINGDVIRHNNLTLASYDDLSVPSGAEISGIRLVWTGGAAEWDEDSTVMRVYNGDAWSDYQSAADGETVTNWPSVGTTIWDGGNDLWGLDWDYSKANSIKTQFYVEGDTAYHDAFEIKIYYSVASAGPIHIPSGKITIAGGKITIG